VACSGGADSSALVLALAAATKELVVAHVIHDLRPETQALSDRDAARSLAERLGLAFVESRVNTRDLLIDGLPAPRGVVRRSSDRNPEGLARRLRYLALARLAEQHGVRFIATAHHAGDQLESILMALVRGAGPRGLRGTAASRRLRVGSGTMRLIRPMLRVTREDAERLCREAGWAWREDATNADTTRVRSRLRHGVAVELRRVRPGVETRAAASAELMRDAAGLVGDRARAVLALAEIERAPDGKRALSFEWPVGVLRNERRVVVGEVIRRAARRLTRGAGADRASHASIARILDAVHSQPGRPRRFVLHGVRVTVTARSVRIEI
jgi:tRNA(Ile)-lysidine synthase